MAILLLAGCKEEVQTPQVPPVPVYVCPEQVERVSNSGHRGGADAFVDMPDNQIETLVAFKKCSGPERKDFVYLEFDIREVGGRLLVSHDPSTDSKAPLLSEYAQYLIDTNFPVVFEIKSLKTDTGRMELLDLMEKMNDESTPSSFHRYFDFPKQRVNVFSYQVNFSRSFGAQWQFWCQLFKSRGFEGIWTPEQHGRNNCDFGIK